jgi:hypothetical protein
MLAYGSIIVFFSFFITSNFQKLKDWQKALFACSVNIYVAIVISHTLKFILGRSDPKQFIAATYFHKILPYGFTWEVALLVHTLEFSLAYVLKIFILLINNESHDFKSS